MHVARHPPWLGATAPLLLSSPASPALTASSAPRGGRSARVRRRARELRRGPPRASSPPWRAARGQAWRGPVAAPEERRRGGAPGRAPGRARARGRCADATTNTHTCCRGSGGSAAPPASLEEILPALVRRIAWSGDARRGTVRIELGSGALAGATLLVAADDGRVQVTLSGRAGHRARVVARTHRRRGSRPGASTRTST